MGGGDEGNGVDTHDREKKWTDCAVRTASADGFEDDTTSAQNQSADHFFRQTDSAFSTPFLGRDGDSTDDIQCTLPAFTASLRAGFGIVVFGTYTLIHIILPPQDVDLSHEYM